ncbi:MAG: methylthioribulose 1-phosphate dehydratase [Myxococcota bacterium]
MKVSDFHDLASDVCRTVREFGTRGWCFATGGNFSARVDGGHCLITQSGRDKSNLRPEDLMLCDLEGRPTDPALKPSAETALHVALYRWGDDVGSVLHTHSITSTVVGRACKHRVPFEGFEMQKSVRGQSSLDARVDLPVFEFTQDMNALAAEVQQALSDGAIASPGFLVRGHGLYAWGQTVAEAKRHVEGIEFLLACVWQEMLGAQREQGMH